MKAMQHIIAILLAAVIPFVVISSISCSSLGGSSEGKCGYGMFFMMIEYGIPAFTALAITFTYCVNYFHRKRDEPGISQQ